MINPFWLSENVGILRSASLANSMTGSNKAEESAIIFFMVCVLIYKSFTNVANIDTIKINDNKNNNAGYLSNM